MIFYLFSQIVSTDIPHSLMICMISVPATFALPDLVQFLAPMGYVLIEMHFLFHVKCSMKYCKCCKLDMTLVN